MTQKSLSLKFIILAMASTIIFSCEGPEGPTGPQGPAGEDGQDGIPGTDGKDLTAKVYIPLEESVTPANILDVKADFSSIEVEVLLSSEDELPSDDFIYGSMADGAGLLKNNDTSYILINNIEADYSVARIMLDQNLRPFSGEYILNANASAFTAQCSGSLITPEEHGFGPLYLSGGEWGGASQGVFVTSPFKKAEDESFATMLTSFGQWNVENAVVIGKNAFPGQTVAFIGDDHSDNAEPQGQLGMYVGPAGDLNTGSLYGLVVTNDGITYEMDMEVGETYDISWYEFTERSTELLNTEAVNNGVMGFSRLEDIDWRRGSATNNREIYMAVTGRNRGSLIDKGSQTGRIYKVTLNADDPTEAGTIEVLLDGDDTSGPAAAFHSPDNILVTENYAYIQEDPNGVVEDRGDGWAGKEEANHFAYLYQYDLSTGDLKVVLECNQEVASGMGYGATSDTWEITGMIDITETIGASTGTFLLITQNHGWEPESGQFTDPNANPDVANSTAEGSVLFVIRGLDR